MNLGLLTLRGGPSATTLIPELDGIPLRGVTRIEIMGEVGEMVQVRLTLMTRLDVEILAETDLSSAESDRK